MLTWIPMSRRRWLLGSSAVLGFASCGAPALPPAGPKPGQVDVGYDTRDAEKVTGAVTTLTEKQMANTRAMSVAELLQGRVPGLQVIRGRGGVTYRIRGLNSLQNDRAPLFVLDGVPLGEGAVQSAMAGLTANDIRQVDVLKDVASTAIYGTRGAGGVILITTKR
jgi:TonB-dependent SusC/RagA subfamily outer membrane receptor